MEAVLRSLTNLCTRVQRRLLASCTVIFLSACSDGYPTDDVVGLSAVEMSQPQRLSAMNELGQNAHPDLTWHYRTMPGCRLQWSVSGARALKETVHMPLSGLGIQLRFDKVDRMYNVQVRPAKASDLDERTILQSTQWVDAIQMRLLLRLIQINCAENGEPVPYGNPSPS